MPDGLTMHLSGDGRTDQCRVMRAAKWMLRDRNKEKFEAAERRAEQALVECKKTEPVILLDPGSEPKLWTQKGVASACR
jgi:hypothetical protein